MLLAGGLLLCMWRFVVGCFTGFDAVGLWALLHVWCLMVVAVAAGHAAHGALWRSRLLDDMTWLLHLVHMVEHVAARSVAHNNRWA